MIQVQHGVGVFAAALIHQTVDVDVLAGDGGGEAAQIRQEFSFFTPRFRVYGPQWDVEGYFLGHEYEISSDGRQIAFIEKEWMTWGDCYELNIADPTDTLLALATVLTIDCMVEAQRN